MRIDFASKSAFPITPSASPLARRPQGLYVSTSVTIVCKFVAGGPDVSFATPIPGTVIPISPYIVSAGDVIGL